MLLNRNLDIRDTDWPLCILQCKKEVSQMSRNEQIQILVKDINVVNNLVALIEQLMDYTIEKHTENKNYKLIIKKL